MNKNKQKWISDKIKKLKSQGKSQEQAITQSYAMYNQMLKGGEYNIPKYQEGTGNTQGAQQIGPHEMVWNANTGQYERRFVPRIPNTFFTGNPLTGDMNTYTEGTNFQSTPNEIILSSDELTTLLNMQFPLQKNGIVQKKVGNGIENMPEKLLIRFMQKKQNL